MTGPSTEGDQGARPTAVVTGGNSGIGHECCRQLAAAGWNVCAIDQNVDSYTAPAAASPSAARVHAIRCDVANEDEVTAAFRSVAGSFGQIDALVCCAGVLRTAPLAEMSTADFDTILRVNTRGPWLCTKAALPLLTPRRNGSGPARVVMVGSIAAVRPKVGGGAYAASKAALTQLVRVMAVELAGSEVLINAVAPATVDTPMIRGASTESGYRPSGVSPVGRVAEPADVVAVIRFLLSPGSDYVTGATIPVDGGTSAAFVPR